VSSSPLRNFLYCLKGYEWLLARIVSELITKRLMDLKLRTEPEPTRDNILGIIACNQSVTKLEDSNVAGWWKIQATLNGRAVTGFVIQKYLSPADEVARLNPEESIPAVHLPTGGLNVTRDNARRAYPLTEVAPVHRRRDGGPAEKVTALRQLIEWLNVESSPRYLPIGRTTFCNIYVSDYCYLADAYLPHVWWTTQSLLRFKRTNCWR
jgi:hypothetical protein